MQVRVTGANIDVGQSLSHYVQENLEKSVKKYFKNAISAEVHFTKDAHLFKAVLIVNEGVKGGIFVKSDGESGDVYGAFNEAERRAEQQLRRYKKKIISHRHHGGGIKSIEQDYKSLDASKYVISSLPYDNLEDSTDDELEYNFDLSTKVINEKITQIEKLSVDDAIMKMDLANLPALVFINRDNDRINVVYQRKDGNISWIDPRS